MKAPTLAQVMATLDRMAEVPLWPDFDPRSIPVAVYDGARTWLLRHPSPPAEFILWPEAPDTFVTEGLHPSVRANTSTSVGGLPTAAIMLEPVAGRDERAVASLFVHEMFHVFQGRQHPEWNADIGALFVYPVEAAGHLALRRLEMEALRRAQEAGEPEGCRGWAVTATALRGQRIASLPEDCLAFERGTELAEGLAQYVELKALGHSKVDLPLGEYPPDEIRRRCYATGSAMAMLLDRLGPGWKGELERWRSLDALLSHAAGPSGSGREFTEVERRKEYDRALEDIAELKRRREALRDDFRQKPGHRVTVRPRSPSGLLRLRAMDPSNCVRLEDGAILHTRYLHTGNATTDVEMLQGTAMTQTAGEHPLYGGFREVVLVGLAERPEIVASGRSLRLRAMGLSITSEDAQLTEGGWDLVVEVN